MLKLIIMEKKMNIILILTALAMSGAFIYGIKCALKNNLSAIDIKK